MLNNKQFSAKLSGIVKSAKSQRDTIQLLIISGLEQYREHGDTGQLTRLVTACVGVRSLPTTVIKEYIKTCANVTYVKAKDGSMVFKKAAGQKEPVIEFHVDTWYNWEGNTQAAPKADFDIHARLKALYTSLNKAVSDGKVKDGQEEEAQRALEAIGAFVAN